MENQKPLEFNSEEEKKKFFEAVKFEENKSGSNPEEKYKTGSIQRFEKSATDENGEYKPYIDSTIAKTKEELNEIFDEIEKSKKSSFGISPEHADPQAYREQKLKEMEEDGEIK